MADIGTYQGVPINPGTDAQVQQQVAQIDARGTQPTTVAPISPTIPVSTLTGTPPTPATVTQPQPSTGLAGLQGTINAGQDAFTQGLAQNTAQAQANVTPVKDAFYQALLGQTTTGAETNKAYAETVDPAQAALKDINNQILAEQVSARHQIESLQNNPQGLYGQGLQDKIEQINRQSIAKQADLSVIQLAKQGQYDSAKAIADRAVAALVEGQKNKIEALKTMYLDNKDTFTKAEDRQFQVMLKDKETKAANEEYRLRAKFDQSIKQNDPLYRAQLAKAQADARTASETPGGVASTALTKQAGYSKLTSTQKGKADSLNNLISYLSDYKTAYNAKVNSYGNKITGEDAALLESKLNSLLFAAAQAEGTGALQAADRAVLEKVLPNPTTLTGAASAFFKGGKEGGVLKIDDQLAKYTNNLGTYGLKPVIVEPTQQVTAKDPLNLGLGSLGPSNPLGL